VIIHRHLSDCLLDCAVHGDNYHPKCDKRSYHDWFPLNRLAHINPLSLFGCHIAQLIETFSIYYTQYH